MDVWFIFVCVQVKVFSYDDDDDDDELTRSSLLVGCIISFFFQKIAGTNIIDRSIITTSTLVLLPQPTCDLLHYHFLST